jgi:crotonobetainyl-CoA:carnitine CoA-transferase CaiB-like acyl-CoA transferase
MPEPEQQTALNGLRVVEVAGGVAAAFCGKLLADFGADVITVEPPGGSELRRLGPFANRDDANETGALHLYLNSGKKSITIDTGTASGRAALLRLLPTTAALIDDRPVGTLAAEGLPDERLERDFPVLVVTHLSAFGQTGPYATAPATNLTSFASGGQMAPTGEPDREPLKNGGFQAEYQLGLNGFTATLAGIWAAMADGEGDSIDVAAMECMTSTLEVSLNAYAYARIDFFRGRRGNVPASTMGLFQCADGYVGIHAMPRNFPALARLIDAEWMIEDERFRDGPSRLAHDDELRAMIYAWTAGQEKKAAYERAGHMRAPLAYVHDMSDLFESPHLQARKYLQRVEHPVAGEYVLPGPLFRMSDTPAQFRRAPLLGDHTEAVLGELGYSEADIDVLRGTGVIS